MEKKKQKKNAKNYWELENNNVAKYEILVYFGCDIEKYIDNLIENDIREDDEGIIKKIRKRSETNVMTGIYLGENIDNDIYNLEGGSLLWKQNIDLNVPKGIVNLEFGHYYNKKTIIPDGVTRVRFGYYYDQETIIANSVTHLKFGNNYNRHTAIPESVVNLEFGYCYDQETVIPTNVTHLVFGCSYNKETVLPNSLICVEFGYHYN